MRTFEPLKLPSYTHPEIESGGVLKSESEGVHVSGSTFSTPHILLISRSSSRGGTLLGPEISQRTCASGERGTGKNEVKAHIVQIVDQRSQVFAPQTSDSTSVFLPAEEIDELVEETRRSSVEIIDFFL